MIWFDTIFATHVKLHAYAISWDTNVNAPLHFQQRNSFVTIMYNYFGHEVFPRLAALTSVASYSCRTLASLRREWPAHTFPRIRGPAGVSKLRVTLPRAGVSMK